MKLFQRHPKRRKPKKINLRTVHLNLLAAAYTVDSLPWILAGIDWGSSAFFVVWLRHDRFGTLFVVFPQLTRGKREIETERSKERKKRTESKMSQNFQGTREGHERRHLKHPPPSSGDRLGLGHRRVVPRRFPGDFDRPTGPFALLLFLPL